jgi:hypothetical protein
MSSQSNVHPSIANLRAQGTSDHLPLLEDHHGHAHAEKPHGRLTNVQAAFLVGLGAVQIINVVASIYLRSAMGGAEPPHPIVFALYREVIAGAVLPHTSPPIALPAVARIQVLSEITLVPCRSGGMRAGRYCSVPQSIRINPNPRSVSFTQLRLPLSTGTYGER